MYPLLADSPGSTPSVLCALVGVSAVPALFVVFEGVLIVIPQTTNPAASSLTWNIGALWRVIPYRVKLVAPVVWMRTGLDPPPPFASHHDWLPPIMGSPPWPSMTPLPTIPDLAPFAEINAVAVP